MHGVAAANEQPLLRCRAWYHNAEDGRDEIYRRIAAVCQHYAIDQSELEGWLFVTSGLEMPIKIAALRNGTVTIDGPTAEAIIRTISDNEMVRMIASAVGPSMVTVVTATLRS